MPGAIKNWITRYVVARGKDMVVDKVKETAMDEAVKHMSGSDGKLAESYNEIKNQRGLKWVKATGWITPVIKIATGTALAKGLTVVGLCLLLIGAGYIIYDGVTGSRERNAERPVEHVADDQTALASPTLTVTTPDQQGTTDAQSSAPDESTETTPVEGTETTQGSQPDHPAAKFLGKFLFHEGGVNYGASLNLYFQADGTGVFNWLALPNTHIDWLAVEESKISISYQSIVEYMTIYGTLDGDILTVVDPHFPDNLYIFIRDADTSTLSRPPDGSPPQDNSPPPQDSTERVPQRQHWRNPPRGGFRRVLPEELQAAGGAGMGATPFIRRDSLNIIGTWWAFESIRPDWDEPIEQDWIVEFMEGGVFSADGGTRVREGTWRISGNRVALSGVSWLNGTWTAEIWIIDDYEILTLQDPDDKYYLVRVEIEED